MMTKLQNPFLVAAFSIMLSVGLGVGMCWRPMQALLQQAVMTPVKAEPSELKKKGWDFWTVEIENLSNELKEERNRLKKQAELLDQRAGLLAAEEKELAKLRSDIEALRKDIADRVTEIGADEMKNIRNLANTYTNISPEAAVAIFRELDDVTAVKILSLMKPDVIGPIFEAMTKAGGADGPMARRAAVLSEKLRLMKATAKSTTSL